MKEYIVHELYVYLVEGEKCMSFSTMDKAKAYIASQKDENWTYIDCYRYKDVDTFPNGLSDEYNFDREIKACNSAFFFTIREKKNENGQYELDTDYLYFTGFWVECSITAVHLTSG